MANQLVSVLIPCFNAERWIGETLACLLNQTHANVEIIVVDDGSADESIRIVENTSSPKVRLIRQENAGASVARNIAFENSIGDFIQFLDADDLLAPDKIELQLRRLALHPDSVACAEWARFTTNSSAATFIPDDTWADAGPVDWLLANWCSGEGMLYPARWLIPRSVALAAGPWNQALSLNDDGEYFTRVVLASDGVVFCPGSRSYYRSAIPGSLSGLKTIRGWQSQHASIELCQRHLLSVEDSERTRKAIAMLWLRFAHASYPYPYASNLANDAMQRGRELHYVKLKPDGGTLFRVASSVLGWRTARRLQRWSGRN